MDAINRGAALLRLFLAMLSLVVGVVGAFGFLTSGWRELRWLGLVRSIAWLIVWALLAWFITPVRPWE
jgi:uncharacterized membrane protein